MLSDHVERFRALFRGWDGAHGRYRTDGFQADPTEKVKGRAFTVEGQTPLDTWVGHLSGTGPGLGQIPLLTDYTVAFAAIDVDRYPLDLEGLARRAVEFGFITCRSKSGGGHLFMFFATPQPAKQVRPLLEKIAAYLGYGGVEVFPKQIERVESEQDRGNWINLPYFDAKKTLRYAVHPRTGKAMELAEFLDAAEAARVVSLDDLKVPEPPADVFPGGPPCLQLLAQQGGFPPQTRNNGLYNVAVYLKKADPDGWKDKVAAYNVSMCDSSQSMGEVQDIIKSVSKRDYNYRCKEAPINAVCNRRLCIRRKFGVGRGSAAASDGARPMIESLTKVEGAPVIWFVDYAGHRFQVSSTDDLLSPTSFAVAAVNATNILPPYMTIEEWKEELGPLIASATVVPPAEGSDEKSAFLEYLEDWFTGPSQAKEKDELLLDKPWRSGNEVFFLLRSLEKKMDLDRRKYRSTKHLVELLKSVGAQQDKQWKLRGGVVRSPWKMTISAVAPQPEAQADALEEF